MFCSIHVIMRLIYQINLTHSDRWFRRPAECQPPSRSRYKNVVPRQYLTMAQSVNAIPDHASFHISVEIVNSEKPVVLLPAHRHSTDCPKTRQPPHALKPALHRVRITALDNYYNRSSQNKSPGTVWKGGSVGKGSH